MNLTGRRVVVLGLARSGVAAARVAVARGARVTGLDLRPTLDPIPGVTLELGPHKRETLCSADLIVVSPGVPATQPDLAAARLAGVPVLGELGFAALFLDAPAVGITGTNGKSTVTWFTGQLLAAAGRRAFVGGNLGDPLCNAVLDPTPFDALVVEVSSYQLENAGSFHPVAGVVLNLTPDHLARHGTLEAYGRAKLQLFAHMTERDLAILPHADPVLTALASGGPGARTWLGVLPGVVRRGSAVEIRVPARSLSADFDLSGFRVPGEHNRDNAATAALLALALGVSSDAIAAALPGLLPLAHRMEIVEESAGIRWINDSKATNIDATRVGLSGLGQRAVVLLGGEAKGPGFAALAPLLGGQRAVICFGGSGNAIADELATVGVHTARVAWLEDAVVLARSLAEPGDAVLLSPGCASFDQFTDFEHRGRVFSALARGSA